MELAVVIFPTICDDRYAAVKTLLTASAAVPSQIIHSRTITDPTKLRSSPAKILLQVTCKMGGELWAIDIPFKSTMVCGADVSYDLTRRGQLVVAFVASTSPSMTRWYSRTKYTIPGAELVDTLKTCLLECIQKYHEVLKYLSVICNF